MPVNVKAVVKNVLARGLSTIAEKVGRRPHDAQLKQKDDRIGTLTRRVERQNREIEELRVRAAATSPETGALRAENVVWILGSPRTGSTWLGRMMGHLDGVKTWHEPFFGVMLSFRDNIANSGYAEKKTFLFGEPNKPIWLEHMKRMVLAVGEARFGSPGRLVVKEPNGSVGSGLILEAFPESGVVLLVRDPRDVVASLMDLAKPGAWYGYDRFEMSTADADFDPQTGSFSFARVVAEDDRVGHLARGVMASFKAAREAFDAHEGRKALVRYEDLRSDPLGTMKSLCSALEIPAGDEELARSIDAASWEKVPAEKKGQGKHHRKATPGGWREDLTPEQARVVEEANAPLLAEFYPER